MRCIWYLVFKHKVFPLTKENEYFYYICICVLQIFIKVLVNRINPLYYLRGTFSVCLTILISYPYLSSILASHKTKTSSSYKLVYSFKLLFMDSILDSNQICHWHNGSYSAFHVHYSYHCRCGQEFNHARSILSVHTACLREFSYFHFEGQSSF